MTEELRRRQIGFERPERFYKLSCFAWGCFRYFDSGPLWQGVPEVRSDPAADQIALPAILTINAISAVLNTNEMMPCTVAGRRVILSVIATAETCAGMPSTNR